MARLLTLIAAVAALSASVAEAAQSKPRIEKIRVLYLDQSVGFVHRPVARPKNSNGPTPSEIALAEIGAKTPMKRAAQPEEIAPAYVFLASPQTSSYITGEILPIIGGYNGG